MQGRAVARERGVFVFRVKVGEYEVEVCGSRDEVLRTVEDLPRLAASVHRAFEGLKPKSTATLSVKTEATKEEAVVQKFPKILRTQKCDEAVLRVLESDWGKWRPRMIAELVEALKANGLGFSGRVLAGTLLGLVRKGMVRRWKTGDGYVYILAEKEALG